MRARHCFALLALTLAPCTFGAQPQDRVETERLRSSIAALPVHRAIRGDEEDLAGLAEASEILEKTLAEMGYEVHEQAVEWKPFGTGEPRQSRNLWVDIEGRGTPREVILVAAHYDAVVGSPGADDNGTGVAAVLELARVLRDEAMDKTVRLMLTTAEEVGLVGSRRYVAQYVKRSPAKGEERIVGMISLDMLGYFSDEPGSQKAPTGLPKTLLPTDQGNFIGMLAILPHASFHVPLAEAMMESAPGLKVISTGLMPIPLPDMARSDHAPFWGKGVPAVLLSDTADFRNPHYHWSTDTIETIDFERYTQVVRGLAGAVHRLAGPVGEGEASESASP
ncbi:MAG: M20/M25/M40 family metallo-hydrolase [Phycisphaerales bacterium]